MIVYDLEVIVKGRVGTGKTRLLRSITRQLDMENVKWQVGKLETDSQSIIVESVYNKEARLLREKGE